MKKIALLLTAILLMLSIAPAFADTGALVADTKQLQDYDDVLTFTGFFQTSPYFGNDNLQHKWLEESLKLKIDGSFSTDATPANKLSLMVASGEMPDVVWVHADYRPIIEEMIEADMLAPINEYFDIMPNFLKYRNEDIIDYWSSDDGNLYMLPGFVLPAEYVEELGIGDPMVMAIREDVLKATGMEIPTTIDGFYELLKASKEVLADSGPLYEGFIPLGLFDNQEFEGEPKGRFANALPHAFGLPGGSLVIDDENGYVLEAFMTEPWADATRFMAKLYREGLLDSEVITADREALLEKGKMGRYGVLFATISDFGDNIEGAIDRLGIEDDYICIQLPKAEGVEHTYWLDNKNSLGSHIGVISKNAPDIERIAKYVDWQNTPIGNMITWWGGPDKEESWFYINEDGEAVRNGVVSDKILNGEMDVNYISPWTYWIAGLGVTVPSDINASIIDSPGVRPFHQASKDIGLEEYFNDPKLDRLKLAPKGEMYSTYWTDIAAIVNKYRAELIMRTATDEEFDAILETMYSELDAAGVYKVAAEKYETYKEVNDM